ncbi:MAG: hypothetical protein V4655_01080 [Bdellovibrionota bacterium]|nr:MAG: hypothetical protein EOP10_17880 [Pseudomonadota bacterium]
MAKTKASTLSSTLKENINVKAVASTVIGGALLLYAYKNRSSKLGKLASVAGSSLLGRGLSGVGIL